MSTRLLVGQDDERRRLRGALETACSGSGRVVLLGGEAGIGKTALIGDLARAANDRDIPVHTGYCVSSRSPAPYGPWIELSRIARLSGDAPGGVIAGLAGDTSSSDVFQEIEQLITSARPGRPVVMVLEDLHWADQASLDLFWALARHIERMPLLLAGTYRPLDPGQESPFARVLPELYRLDQVDRLSLSPLGLSALSTLARDQYRLNPADAGRLARYLLRYAGGNPFYTAELLATLEHQGLIQEHRGGYEIGQLHEAVIPPIVQQLVQTRIADIDDSLRHTLQAAAALGGRFSYDQLLSFCGTSEEDLDQAIAAGVAARIFAPGLNSASVTFSHALIQETIYQTIPPGERRDIHRRIADMLIRQPDPDPDAIAHHLSQCDAPEAIDWLMKAGDRAYASHAWVVARERFQEALTRLDTQPADPERRAWLLYRLALTERWEHELAAIHHLEEAEALARQIGDRLLEAYCAFFQGSIYWFRDECKRAKPYIDASVELLDQAPKGGDVSPYATTVYGFGSEREINLATFNPVEGSITIMLASTGWHCEALKRGRSFLEAHAGISVSDSTSAKAFGDAHSGIGLSLAVLGQPEEARRHFTLGSQAYDVPNLKSLAVHHMVRNVLIPYFSTDQQAIAASEQEIERIHNSVEALFTFDIQLMTRATKHRTKLLEGDWNAAMESATGGQDLLHNAYRADAASTIAEIARLRGNFDRAWAHINMILPDGPNEEPGSMRYLVGLYTVYVASNLALDQEDLDLARAWIDTYMRWLNWGKAILGRAECSLLWTRFHLATADQEQATACAREALAIASSPEQPPTLVAIHRQLGSLASAAGRFDEAAKHLQLAHQLADTTRMNYELALVESELIALSIATGKTAELARRIEQVRGYLESIGAMPALRYLSEIEIRYNAEPSLATGFSTLTAREADVLKLVATGLSNADVAKQLSISPRTVTTHLSSIYRKLETSSRTTITRIAIERGLTGT